jgi:hypothetical protein
MSHRVLGRENEKRTLYEKSQNSDLERINKLNNVAMHFNADQAERTSAPIWITDEGLECLDNGIVITLSFRELHENVTALFEVA